MPDQNNRNDRNPNDNKGGGDRNRKNLNGLIILIGWALVLTVGLNWLSVYLTSSEEAIAKHRSRLNSRFRVCRKDRLHIRIPLSQIWNFL